MAGRSRHEIERSLRFQQWRQRPFNSHAKQCGQLNNINAGAWLIGTTTNSDSQATLFSATPAGNGTLQYDFILENDQLIVYGIDTFFVYQKKLSHSI